MAQVDNDNKKKENMFPERGPQPTISRRRCVRDVVCAAHAVANAEPHTRTDALTDARHVHVVPGTR
jgi:hypothetical protein